MDSEKKGLKTAKSIAYIAVFSAILTGGKFALSFLPNVEIVTLLILVYASVFGFAYALPAVVVFCATEMLIYGTGIWVILYFIHWPILAVVASWCCKKQKTWVALAVGLSSVILFGVLSSLLDTIAFSYSQGTAKDFFAMFALYYARGIFFYIVQFVGNLAFILCLYRPLCRTLQRIQSIRPL